MSVKYYVSGVVGEINVSFEGEVPCMDAAIVQVQELIEAELFETAPSTALSPMSQGQEEVLEPPKFKEGDKVVATRYNLAVPEGTKGVIKEVDEYDTKVSYRVAYEDGETYWEWPGGIAPDTAEVAPKESSKAPELKVGDKVRIVRKIEGHTGGWKNSWVDSMDDRVNDGCVYTVDDINESGVYFEEIGYGWPPAALEVVPKDATEESPEGFKVGDKVRVVQPCMPLDYKMGDIGEITGFFDSGNLWVSFAGKDSVCVYPKEVELVPNLEPRVGARIRIVNAGDSRYSDGHVGTIVNLGFDDDADVLFDADQEGVKRPELTKYVYRAEYEVIG